MLADAVDDNVEYFSNSQDKLIINKIADYPVLKNIWIYNPSTDRRLAIAMMALLPISLPVWWFGRKYRKELIEEISKVIKINGQVEELIYKNSKK